MDDCVYILKKSAIYHMAFKEKKKKNFHTSGQLPINVFGLLRVPEVNPHRTRLQARTLLLWGDSASHDSTMLLYILD